MAKTDYKSVDHYIGAQPDAVQAVLEKVRSTIRKAVPGAEEVISYQIPAFKLDGGSASLFFAGWKQHYSLYPLTAALVEAFKDELAGYELSKGTIRFPLSEPVPVKLIERIARFRAKEIAASRKAKADAAGKQPKKAASGSSRQPSPGLQRALNPMPEHVRAALDQARTEGGLRGASRLPAQRLSGLDRPRQARRDQGEAPRPDARRAEAGGVYMNMAWRG